MAKNNNLTDFVRDLADGIREKCGFDVSEKINPQDFRAFVDNSPAFGSITDGLESLNWERTITDIEEQITCPAMPKQHYFDESTETPRLPLIRFTFTVLDPLEGEEDIRFYDDATVNTFVILNEFNSTGSYILPVFAVRDEADAANFPPFDMKATNIRAAGVRFKMEASWVQIGDPSRYNILSTATMRGFS